MSFFWSLFGYSSEQPKTEEPTKTKEQEEPELIEQHNDIELVLTSECKQIPEEDHTDPNAKKYSMRSGGIKWEYQICKFVSPMQKLKTSPTAKLIKQYWEEHPAKFESIETGSKYIDLYPIIQLIGPHPIAKIYTEGTFPYINDVNPIQEIKAFVKRNGCLPSVKSDSKHIRRLGQWIGKQIDNYHANKLSSDKINLLYTIPNWTFLNRDQIMLSNVNEFASKYTRIPLVSTTNPWEHHLASWLNSYIKRYTKGLLSEDEIKKLAKIPGIVF